MKAKSFLFLCLVLISANQSFSQIIADHTVVDQYSNIPDQYIQEVKKMLVGFPGESHSGAYRDGLILLHNLNSKFAAITSEDGVVPAYTTNALRCARQVIINASDWSSTTGESRWYADPNARGEIKNHIKYCKDHNLNLAAIGFGWCWDMSWTNAASGGLDTEFGVHWAGSSDGGPQGNLIWGLNAADQTLTGNSVCMDTYIQATMEYLNYCATNSINTKVIFTTGPVDDDSFNKDENGYQRSIKQDYIRNYVKNSSSNLILFDFADILSYSNSGVHNMVSWNTHNFEFIHPDNMLMLDGSPASTGYHFGERGALRIAKAMWWLLARIAGWNGISTSVDDPNKNTQEMGQLVIKPEKRYDRVQITLPTETNEKLKIEIYTVSGSCIYSKILKSSDRNLIIDNLSIEQGLYLISVSDEKMKYSGKFLYQ